MFYVFFYFVFVLSLNSCLADDGVILLDSLPIERGKQARSLYFCSTFKK